jgi:acyl carrier protein
MRKLAMLMATALCLLAIGGGLDRGWAQSGGGTGNTVNERVNAIVIKHLGVAANKVTPGARFKEDLGADELVIVELTMAFEEEFKIEIVDSDAEKFVRVGDVIRYLRGKVK